MAQVLTESYRAAMAAPVRRPLVTVTAYPTGEEREITGDIVSWSIERYREPRAGTATVAVANPGGAASWLTPGTKVTIHQGLRTANGDETLPIFTGEVCTAETRYRRGEGEVLAARLLDRAGRAFAREITSPRYQGMQANAIVTALFTDFMGLTEDDIQLAPADYLTPDSQFVEETLMDAGCLLMQAARRRLFFDAEGRLRSASVELPNTPQWTDVAARDILWLRENWTPPAATTCAVTGRMQASLRQVGEETLWQEVTASAYQFGMMVNVPFAPTGAVYEEVRVEPVTPLAPFEQIALYGVSPDGITVKILSPAGRALTFRCYGKQVFYTTPYVLATADDADLSARFGAIRRDVANPAVKDETTALWLATQTINEARWSMHTVTLRLLANPAIEPGDALAIIHPRTGQPLLLLANAIGQAGQRGLEEYTTVEGWVVG